MKTYTLNKYDFKKYLLDELPDTRQEDLIFWKKTIPLPVDLIYNIFDYRGELLTKYLDHIAAAYIYGMYRKENSSAWQGDVELQPNKENCNRQAELIEIFKKGIENTTVRRALFNMADLLMLNRYIPNEHRLFNAFCHEGRKYKRLFIPPQIRGIIKLDFPELLSCIGISNWDMFSNVVADELKIYRMGFADAFSGIFNKLIEFIITNNGKGKIGYSNSNEVRITQAEEEDEADNYNAEGLVGQVSDGSIWEPRYVNARTSFVLNRHHPFYDLVNSKGDGAKEIFKELISSLAEIENEIVKDSDRHVIEILRQDLSRKLRLKVERLKTLHDR
jgi:hypothetical protein